MRRRKKILAISDVKKPRETMSKPFSLKDLKICDLGMKSRMHWPTFSLLVERSLGFMFLLSVETAFPWGNCDLFLPPSISWQLSIKFEDWVSFFFIYIYIYRFAFIDLRNGKGNEKALELNGSYMGGKELEVTMACRRDEYCGFIDFHGCDRCQMFLAPPVYNPSSIKKQRIYYW